MLVVGLTGGIGSGKSTVAKLFAQHGIKIIDTDEIARQLTHSDQEAFKKIVDYFGPDILSKDSNLNRAKLRNIVFADPHKRHWLERLLHPLIRSEIKQLIASASSPYCIVVIPLLFETEPNPIIQRILVVDTPEEEQINRVKLRDSLPESEITAILQSQATRQTRIQGAHDVIENTGSPEQLEAQVHKLHHYYLTLSTGSPSIR